ncbi:desmoglein-3-like [Hypomesus transpacificus]|uniref:desmoglein-3-like n=1 Tax=Hypomesus transpacificus TaxID=137520 RepID=UPI001F084520|nr:desmoglein-3-like [Hypomesus transpacificus]
MEKAPTFTLLLCSAILLCGDRACGGPCMQRHLKRHKREWVVPAQKLKENFDYTDRKYVAKIRSDLADSGEKLFYTLTGRGASKDPVNLFIVGENDGLVRIRGILDRERIPKYTLNGVARFQNGTVAEEKIDLNIEVVDENDNPPVFDIQAPATVIESSPPGTVVTKVTATDADEANSLHSKISYSITKQEPTDGAMLFSIDRNTGFISVKNPSIDREKYDSYLLTVKGTDMDGASSGNTGTTQVKIQVVDINDNLPVLEKDEYSGSINENTVDVEVMRFQALDSDLEKTDNWLAEFEIVSGNEDQIFGIHTDPRTNEGVLTLKKPVDFELHPNLQLGLVVTNRAPFVGGAGGGGGGAWVAGGTGGGTWGGTGGGTGVSSGAAGSKLVIGGGKRYPVKIAVKNLPDGPVFRPAVKPLSISESPGDSVSKVIATYKAVDGDTGKPAENVQYAKGFDPDNWLSVNPDTAEITLNKQPDRESPFLVNGTYYAKILCLTKDMPIQTATGTIAIHVEDLNDNCPVLISTQEYLCSGTERFNVTAEDLDANPNGAPLKFTLVSEESMGAWMVEEISDTNTSLRAMEPLWPGLYDITLIIQDQQGLACPEPQHLLLQVCTCSSSNNRTCGVKGADGEMAALKGSSSFGLPAIGILVLAFLILLLMGLLMLTFPCGEGGTMFVDLPFEPKQHLISYHLEGQGEDREVPLKSTPWMISAPAPQTTLMGLKWANTTMAVHNMAAVSKMSAFGGTHLDYQQTEMVEMDSMDMTYFQGMEDSVDLHDALPDHILDDYYSQKTTCLAENYSQKDSLLLFDYEGQGSPVGSVGCCSLLESDDDLQFLSDLGPKFRTLAEVCSGEKIQTEFKPIVSAPPPPRPAAPLASSTTTIVTVASSTVAAPPPPAPVKHVERTVVKKSERSGTLREGMAGQNHTFLVQQPVPLSPPAGQTILVQQPVPLSPPAGQTILVQQPMYYATTPMLQPMNYVVEPQVHNTVLLAERPAANLQGMITVNGPPPGPAQGLMVQGQRVVSSGPAQGQGMVLVERSGGGGQARLERGNSQGMIVVNGPSTDVLTGHVERTISAGHTGMLSLPPSSLKRGERVVIVGKSQGVGPNPVSCNGGQATLAKMESVVLPQGMGGGVGGGMGGGGGQTILVEGGVGFGHLQNPVGALQGPQNFMLAGRHIPHDYMGSEPLVLEQVFQSECNGDYVGGHFMVENPVSLSSGCLRAGALSPVSLGPLTTVGPVPPNLSRQGGVQWVERQGSGGQNKIRSKGEPARKTQG